MEDPIGNQLANTDARLTDKIQPANTEDLHRESLVLNIYGTLQLDAGYTDYN